MLKKEEIFKQLYDKYFNKVYNFLLSRTNSQNDTEDLVQEIFLGIWKGMDSLDGKSNINAWVFQISRNKFNDFLRRKYKIDYKKVDLDFLELDNLADDFEKFEDDSYANEVHKKAVELISKLEKNYREVLELRFLRNYKLAEIAKELGLSENNVKVIQYRAIKKLKELIISTTSVL